MKLLYMYARQVQQIKNKTTNRCLRTIISSIYSVSYNLYIICIAYIINIDRPVFNLL